MSFKPSDNYYGEFTTASPTTGAATNADSLPVATANHNGTDDGTFTLTVTNIDAGRYKITGTVPSGYAANDIVNVSVAATCSSVAGKAVVDTFDIVLKRPGDTSQVVASVTNIAAQTGDSYTRLGAPAGASVSADVAAINSKTTNLPVAPADESLVIAATTAIYNRIGVNGAGLSAVPDTSGTTTLLSRITASVALASQIPANFTTAIFASAGVFATAALANAPTGGSAPTVVQIRTEMDTNSTKLVHLDQNISAAVTLPSTVPAGYATFANQATIATAIASVPALILTDPTKTLKTVTGGYIQADMTQPITDIQTATVGGALNGAWAVSWGKTVKTIIAKTLGIWGAGNVSGTASKTFSLDDGTSPTSRT